MLNGSADAYMNVYHVLNGTMLLDASALVTLLSFLQLLLQMLILYAIAGSIESFAAKYYGFLFQILSIYIL